MDCLIAGLALAAVLQNPASILPGRISGVVIEEGTNDEVLFPIVDTVFGPGPWERDYLVAANNDRPDRMAIRAVTTYYPNALEASAAQIVSVQAGHTVKDITIHMAAVRVFRVSGIVTDAGGTPIPNVSVMLMPDMRGDGMLALIATGARGSVQSDADGAFAFEGIPPGSYVVSTTGDAGLEGFTGSVAIDSTGALTAATNAKELALAPGTVAIAVADSDVADVKIVVKKPA